MSGQNTDRNITSKKYMMMIGGGDGGGGIVSVAVVAASFDFCDVFVSVRYR